MKKTCQEQGVWKIHSRVTVQARWACSSPENRVKDVHEKRVIPLAFLLFLPIATLGSEDLSSTAGHL